MLVVELRVESTTSKNGALYMYYLFKNVYRLKMNLRVGCVYCLGENRRGTSLEHYIISNKTLFCESRRWVLVQKLYHLLFRNKSIANIRSQVCSNSISRQSVN